MAELLDPKVLAQATKTATLDDWISVLDEYVRSGVMEKLPDGRYLVPERPDGASRIAAKYDPVCHCGIELSHHSPYENHAFTDMEMPPGEVELMPCPFCGPGASIVTCYSDDYGYWAVACGACGTRSGKRPSSDPKAAEKVMALWNTRHTEPIETRRLNWLIQTGCWLIEVPVVPPRHFEVRDCDDNAVGKGDTAREAIDDAMAALPVCPGCGEPGHDPGDHELYPEDL